VKGLVLAVVALLGCDRVFNLEGRQEIDAAVAIDASIGTVASMTAPGSVYVDETVAITASLQGPPGSTVDCSFSATAGGFAAQDILVVFDDTGAGMAIASYTAPATPGTVTVQAVLGGSMQRVTVTVRDFGSLGNDTNLGGTSVGLNEGFLLGTQVVVPNPFKAVRLGVWMDGNIAGLRGRIGLYRANNSLLFETGLVTLVENRNVFPISPQTIPAGTYRVIVAFNENARVFSMSGGSGEGYVSSAVYNVDQPLPPQLVLGTAQATKYALFLVGM